MELLQQLNRALYDVITNEWGSLDFQILEKLQFSETRKEFDGDYTVVVFQLAGILKIKPEELAGRIGELLMSKTTWCKQYEVVKGFLNVSLNDAVWLQELERLLGDVNFSFDIDPHPVLIEYSSPNTNKPLHLGHVRNILLGTAMARIYEACGYRVIRTQVINDRGIAICKSMLAWKKYGDDKTPDDLGMKSDHFVGHFYVLFEKKFQEEYLLWQTTPTAKALYDSHRDKFPTEADFFKYYKNHYFNEYSILGKEAREMLIAWENEDPATRLLWQRLNQWVYDGFEQTYRLLDAYFDKNYYESITYLYGKELVEEGLNRGVFTQKEDGSVWADLTDVGLDHKVVLRSDGTSVYITQDLGTADQRYRDFGAKKMIYVVADEQNYHFQVLFEIMKRLQKPYASGMYHLSYGMVELPEGKMKSREGTVVDADDLISEVIDEAAQMANERGELEGISEQDRQEIIRKIGIGALKYFMLKVQARKKMVFDPRESVDMQGNTGPYIQNAYVRIRSIMRKTAQKIEPFLNTVQLNKGERELLRHMISYRSRLILALNTHDPAEIADFAYQLAKLFHKFYHESPILNAADIDLANMRLALCRATEVYLQKSMNLLGIEMPERM